MATQGERQDFLWRPNDNSSTTLLRYDLEAKHWMRAFNNAAAKNKPVNYAQSFGTIGLCISLIVSLISLVLISLSELLQFIINKREQSKNKKRQSEFIANEKKKAKMEPIKSIITNRPKVFQTTRSKLFRNAAKYVVLKQRISLTDLMFELNINFEEVCLILNELYEAGIVSDPLKSNETDVIIDDLESLNLLFTLEKSFVV